MSDDDQDDNSAQSRQKNERILARNDLRFVLGTAQGQRFVARILERCGVDRPVFNANGSAMNHAEGRRSIGIEINDDAKEASLEAWLAMLRDRHNSGA
jgi:hydroxymethylpyrimidine pyrophosphatase-like HAD family hydrolase